MPNALIYNSRFYLLYIHVCYHMEGGLEMDCDLSLIGEDSHSAWVNVNTYDRNWTKWVTFVPQCPNTDLLLNPAECHRDACTCLLPRGVTRTISRVLLCFPCQVKLHFLELVTRCQSQMAVAPTSLVCLFQTGYVSSVTVGKTAKICIQTKNIREPCL